MTLLASADAIGATCALLLLLFLSLAIAVAFTRTRRRSGLAAVQRRFGGIAVPEGDGEEATTASLRFESDGLPARLACYSGGEDSAPSSQVELTFTSNFRLSVVPRGLFDGEVDRDQTVGDERFDARFRVICDRHARTLELVDAQVRHDVLALHDLGAGLASKGVKVHVGPTSSVVTVPRDLLSQPDALIEFVELSLDLLQRLRAAK